MATGTALSRIHAGARRSQGMKLITHVNGLERTLELFDPEAPGGTHSFRIDEAPAEADAKEVEPGLYSILIGTRSFEAKIEESEGRYFVAVNGRRYEVAVRDPRSRPRHGGNFDAAGPQQITSPMPGRVVRVMVKEGDQVESGSGLMVVEAMKMQNEIKSPKTGTIMSLGVEEGGSVGAGDVMVVIE